MSEWAAKRFWTDVTVARAETGWNVLLDGRLVRTPAKASLDLPTEAMAHAVSAEWAAQENLIDPRSMPVTRSANSAIDRVAPQKSEVVAMLASYGETDLLCHRADSPERLAQLQADGWDPLLTWAEHEFGARLQPTVGILPQPQDPEALLRLHEVVSAQDPFRLTALHDLIALSGSIVLGLATAYGRIDAETAWGLSRIDEDWQAEQWGRDEEAEAVAAYKFGEFRHALNFWSLSGDSAPTSP